MIKIVHLADTHIRNYKYHKEYKKVFEQIYANLKEEVPDYIVHCGDLAHTKTQLSPEYFEMASGFLDSLADIAPTIVLVGNHDANLKNESRQDAISPIVQTLEHKDLVLHKFGGAYEPEPGLVFNVLSLLEPDKWEEQSQTLDETKINICLFHGAVVGSKTDLGWEMAHGDIELDILKQFDYALLGDIHKSNQILDACGRVRYAGSTVQQNHGEEDNKGYLVWEIEDKKDFKVRHVSIPNSKPFVTVQLNSEGKIPKNVEVKSGSRLRIASDVNIPLDVMWQAIDAAKHRFKPESVTYIKKGSSAENFQITKSLQTSDDNLRDVVVQEKLITEFLKEYEIEEKLLEEVYNLNKNFDTIIKSEDDVMRNISWSPTKAEWDNLFNYGKDNVIELEKLSGTIGIFGGNFSGKTSAVENLLYTIFNSTAKNERKNLNIVNEHCDSGAGRVEIDIGNKKYSITRTTEKYKKKVKGLEAEEAKTDVFFECFDRESGETYELNGLTRQDTDKEIRRVFGTLDDFLLTSMASQHGALTFIDEGSTKRKEIIAKFLDLHQFEKKYKLAKDESVATKGALKKLEGKEFSGDIAIAEVELEETQKYLADGELEVAELRENIEGIAHQLSEVVGKIRKIPDGATDKVVSEDDIKRSQVNEENLQIGRKVLLRKQEDAKQKKEQIENFEENFDLGFWRQQKKEIEEKKNQIKELERSLRNAKEGKLRLLEKTGLLQEIPCGESFPGCKFICNAHEAKGQLGPQEEEFKAKKKELDKEKRGLSKYDEEKVNLILVKHEELERTKREADNKVKLITLELEKNDVQSSVAQKVRKDLEAKYEHQKTTQELRGQYNDLLAQERLLGRQKREMEQELRECEKDILRATKKVGSQEARLEHLKEARDELEGLRREYAAYDLYMKCMHSNGISYNIIKQKLPFINNEIAKILAGVVNFEVFFENDGKHLRIFIKHPRHSPRPIEMGSGAEKTIAAMAVRLALLSVSSLPKSDIFILDEPGVSLDEENMEGFIRMLGMIKEHFRVVFLISHLDSLKDCVDSIITIDKKEGFAHINY